jgi:hypothetical protein
MVDLWEWLPATIQKKSKQPANGYAFLCTFKDNINNFLKTAEFLNS